MSTAFWLAPDWSGGDSLRDGAEPFWMRGPYVEPPRPASPYAGLQNALISGYGLSHYQAQGLLTGELVASYGNPLQKVPGLSGLGNVLGKLL